MKPVITHRIGNLVVKGACFTPGFINSVRNEHDRGQARILHLSHLQRSTVSIPSVIPRPKIYHVNLKSLSGVYHDHDRILGNLTFPDHQTRVLAQLPHNQHKRDLKKSVFPEPVGVVVRFHVGMMFAEYSVVPGGESNFTSGVDSIALTGE